MKDIANKIGVTYDKRHARLCTTIAKHFFNYHSSSPLTSLRKVLNTPTEGNAQAKIDKNHPIFDFLKGVLDDKIKECTKKLGKNNL